MKSGALHEGLLVGRVGLHEGATHGERGAARDLRVGLREGLQWVR